MTASQTTPEVLPAAVEGAILELEALSDALQFWGLAARCAGHPHRNHHAPSRRPRERQAGGAVVSGAEGLACANCEGSGWVCENHLDRPWEGLSAPGEGCDCGAGAPCPVCQLELAAAGLIAARTEALLLAAVEVGTVLDDFIRLILEPDRDGTAKVEGVLKRGEIQRVLQANNALAAALAEQGE